MSLQLTISVNSSGEFNPTAEVYSLLLFLTMTWFYLYIKSIGLGYETEVLETCPHTVFGCSLATYLLLGA